MEQSPLPAVEHSPESPTQSWEQSKVPGPYWTDSAGKETSPVTHIPCLFRLPFGFGAEGEAAPHCGYSHILQSRGGGSKKQNSQKNHRQRLWGENPGCVWLMCQPLEGLPVHLQQNTSDL